MSEQLSYTEALKRIAKLEAENVRLQEKSAEIELGNGILLERIAELKAENKRLQAGYEWIEDLWRATAQVRDDVKSDLNEARHWARKCKQRVLTLEAENADLEERLSIHVNLAMRR
jgi:chromosome segregation ATPase